MRLLVVAIVLAAFDARAEPPASSDLSGTFPDHHLRFEVGAGWPDIGNVSVHGRDVLSAGIHLEAGLRYDRFALALDGGVRVASGDRDHDGTFVRWATVAGRYSLWAGRTAITAKHSDRVTGHNRTDLWLELGAGRDSFDGVSRPTELVGLGWEVTNHGDTLHGSAFLSVRLLRASDPGGGAVSHGVLVGVTLLVGN